MEDFANQDVNRPDWTRPSPALVKLLRQTAREIREADKREMALASNEGRSPIPERHYASR